ncbi:MAG: 2-oxoacid:ferredoxin oxidoreductase subunit gamma [Chloroflexi bacterium]|nr:MAG: 2-oxoacid:ferredoxin oxidoreductase subunit gamma [Chloroflexota bacterium]HDN80893.1 2-oxoacid:ferredoxin oxidoreductase subunit gamma [Chloroflexota bacterium]
MARCEVRLAGEGGQGLILAGVILAEAAVYEGKNVAQTQSYGPEARGGASSSEVVISDDEIDYPKVLEADVFLAMSQEACDKFCHQVRGDGLIIVDSVNVHRVPSGAIQIPITALAEEVTGKRLTASILALGIIVGMTGMVSPQAIREAVAKRVPKGTEEVNLEALKAGIEKGRELASHLGIAPRSLRNHD